MPCMVRRLRRASPATSALVYSVAFSNGCSAGSRLRCTLRTSCERSLVSPSSLRLMVLMRILYARSGASHKLYEYAASPPTSAQIGPAQRMPRRCIYAFVPRGVLKLLVNFNRDRRASSVPFVRECPTAAEVDSRERASSKASKTPPLLLPIHTLRRHLALCPGLARPACPRRWVISSQGARSGVGVSHRNCGPRACRASCSSGSMRR